LTECYQTITSWMGLPFENHVWRQFRSATTQEELRSLNPSDIDWVERTESTLALLLPRMPDLAQKILSEVPANLNSADELLIEIQRGETILTGATEEQRRWFENLRKLGNRARNLIHNIESQQISAEIQRMIVSKDGIGEVVYANGNSIFPDLVRHDLDYSSLPLQSRANVIDGPCLRGAKNKRPSNVPDGCEIKTNRGNKIKVDAHGAHSGLHLGVTWELLGNKVEVTGVWIGFIRISDHRESKRNVKTTTVKYSFGHSLFVSVL